MIYAPDVSHVNYMPQKTVFHVMLELSLVIIFVQEALDSQGRPDPTGHLDPQVPPAPWAPQAQRGALVQWERRGALGLRFQGPKVRLEWLELQGRLVRMDPQAQQDNREDLGLKGHLAPRGLRGRLASQDLRVR